MTPDAAEVRAALEAVLPLVVEVPAGTVLMGTPERELSRLAAEYGGTRESYREESPQHAVQLAAFGLAETVLSRAVVQLWRAAQSGRAVEQVAGDGLLPAAGLTWHDAVAICAWLSELRPQVRVRRADGQIVVLGLLRWRLPTEAEWEYAARGGDGRRFPWGETFDAALANTREAARLHVTAPGAYDAGRSPFGLAEMAGTVWEWTASLDRPYPYTEDGRNDPAAEGRRILRGGCYANPAGYARCACRFRLLPAVKNEFLGLRPACDLSAVMNGD